MFAIQTKTRFDKAQAASRAQDHLDDGDHFDLQNLLMRPELGRLALVSSFGAESAVLLHLVLSAKPGMDVLFIDTGKHFHETLAYRDILAARLNIRNLITVRPQPRVLSEIDPSGKLWQQDADLCCTARKVFPLQDALSRYDTWITGRKRYQGGLRGTLEPVEIDATHLKLNPLAGWSQSDIETYAQNHNLPAHPLVDQGFGSIGCATCTLPTQAGGDLRSGRWAGVNKTECGIHIAAAMRAA